MQKIQNGEGDDIIDTMTTQEKRRLARERELEEDMAAAADLMGATGVEDGKAHLNPLLDLAHSASNRPGNPPSGPEIKPYFQRRLQHPLATDYVRHHLTARIKSLIFDFRRTTGKKLV